MQVSEVKFLTGFNSKGYNNQPQFFSDNEIYISSDWDSEQTDIVKLDLRTKKATRVTRTIAGEYSPTLLENRKNFAVVRQDAEGNQFLWSYPLDHSNRGKNLLADQNKIGYFTWLSSHKVAAFVVGEPHQLVLINKLTEDHKVLAENIGRTLIADDQYLYYVQKSDNGDSELIRYHLILKRKKTLATIPASVEDLAMSIDGSFYYGNNSKLFILKKNATSWQQAVDLSNYGINNITRLKIRKNKICLVDVSK